MSRSLRSCGLVLVLPLVVGATQPLEEPTPAQIQQARADFTPLKARYRAEYDDDSDRITPGFVLPKTTTNADIKQVPNLPFGFGLHLHGTQVTDAGMKTLAGNQKLATLTLGGTSVTGAGLKDLAPLKQLASLVLYENQVTDDVVRELRQNDQLRALIQLTAANGGRPKSLDDVVTASLSGTKLTGAGLKELAVLKNLTSLNLHGTMITDIDLKELAR